MSTTVAHRHARLEARRARRRARSTARYRPGPARWERRRASRDRRRVRLHALASKERGEDRTLKGVEADEKFYENLRKWIRQMRGQRRCEMLTRRDRRELAGHPERQPLTLRRSTEILQPNGMFVPRPEPSPGANRASRRAMFRQVGSVFPSSPDRLRMLLASAQIFGTAGHGDPLRRKRLREGRAANAEG